MKLTSIKLSRSNLVALALAAVFGLSAAAAIFPAQKASAISCQDTEFPALTMKLQERTNSAPMGTWFTDLKPQTDDNGADGKFLAHADMYGNQDSDCVSVKIVGHMHLIGPNQPNYTQFRLKFYSGTQEYTPWTTVFEGESVYTTLASNVPVGKKFLVEVKDRAEFTVRD